MPEIFNLRIDTERVGGPDWPQPAANRLGRLSPQPAPVARPVSRPRTSAATLRRDARQLADVSSYLALGEDDVPRIEGDLGATRSRWPGWLRAMPHLLATGASLGVALGERDGDERLLAAASGLSSLLLAFLAAMEDPDLLTLYRDELGGVAIDLVISGDGVGLSGRF